MPVPEACIPSERVSSNRCDVLPVLPAVAKEDEQCHEHSESGDEVGRAVSVFFRHNARHAAGAKGGQKAVGEHSTKVDCRIETGVELFPGFPPFWALVNWTKPREAGPSWSFSTTHH